MIPLHALIFVVAAVTDAQPSSECRGTEVPSVCSRVHEPSVSRWELRPVGSRRSSFSQYQTKTTLKIEIILYCILLYLF